MDADCRATITLTFLLSIACAQLLYREFQPPLLGLESGIFEVSTPDLSLWGWREFALLPGIGVGQARQMVLERARLGMPLTPDRLILLAGVGPAGAQEIKAWLKECASAASVE